MKKVQSNNWPSEPMSEWKGRWMCVGILLCFAVLVAAPAMFLADILRMLGIAH